MQKTILVLDNEGHFEESKLKLIIKILHHIRLIMFMYSVPLI